MQLKEKPRHRHKIKTTEAGGQSEAPFSEEGGRPRRLRASVFYCLGSQITGTDVAQTSITMSILTLTS